MSKLADLARSEPLWVAYAASAAVAFAAHFGLKLGADAQLGVGLALWAAATWLARKFTSPARPAPPAAGQPAKEQITMNLAQDLAAAWAIVKPLIPVDAVTAEANDAIAKLDAAVNGGIDAELAKVVPAAFEPEVAAVVNEGLNLVEQAIKSGVDAKLQAVAKAQAAVPQPAA